MTEHRGHDDKEPLTSDEDLLRAALTRGEDAEADRDKHRSRAEAAQAQITELERTVREHSEEIERLVVRAVQAEQRARTAEANATDYLDRATCAEEDRDRIESQARRAHDDLAAARPLVDHYKQRAESAETRRDYWMERTSEAEAERNLWFARAQAVPLDCRTEGCTEDRTECSGCNEAELERYAAQVRAGAWWEAAKTLCRARNKATWLLSLVVVESISKGSVL